MTVRVTKNQIVNGLAAYIQDELLPKMQEDRALQIALNVAVNAVKANDRLIETVFGQDAIKALLKEDGEGRYEIGGLMDMLKASVEKYGAFPLTIPPIPLIAPQGANIKLNAEDIATIRLKIVGAEGEETNA